MEELEELEELEFLLDAMLQRAVDKEVRWAEDVATRWRREE